MINQGRRNSTSDKYGDRYLMPRTIFFKRRRILMLRFGIALLSAAMLLVFSEFNHANEAAPEPGGACAEQDALYNYSSNVEKTHWKLKELYAVPVGTTDPAAWELSADFNTQFIAELQSGDTPQAFAAACSAVWGSFFTGDAAVIVRVNRTITSIHKTLKCDSGVWDTLSTENVEFNDISDWLTANSNPYDVTNQDAVGLLEADLQNILTDLNAQPGTD